VVVLRAAAVLSLSTVALAGATFPQGQAVLRTPTKTVTVQVELAQTDEQLQQGLQGRKSLARNAGMAFLFGRGLRARFWMKDTKIPLSIAFWGRRGRILKILDMAPCVRDPCPRYDPGGAFWGALEVNRGAFRRWGVRAGDFVSIRR
jgi:uncharacterized membrane protein (UPF0127 family)